MSDIFIAKPGFTKKGQTLFGQNVNKEPNEGQGIIRLPAMSHTQQVVACSYIEIPQASHTQEVVLSKPHGGWGGEMGMNRAGLCIGQSAIPTRIRHKKSKQGLTGTDLTRLALERCRTVREAFELITQLLETHGAAQEKGLLQYAELTGCSFLITDGQYTLLLETAGTHWVGKEIKDDFFALCGTACIEEHFDFQSKEIVNFAKQAKWLKKDVPFSFKKNYTKTPVFGKIKAEVRKQQLCGLAELQKGELDLQGTFKLLSGHKKKRFSPSTSGSQDMCQHTNKRHPQQTNNSMVAVLDPKTKKHTCWMTGTSSPCLSVFKPVYLPGNNLFEGIFPEPGLLKDDSLWWKAEQFHRLMATNYKKDRSFIQKEREEVQQWLIEADQKISTDQKAQDELSNKAILTHRKKLMVWAYDLRNQRSLWGRKKSPAHRRYLARLSRMVTSVLD